MTTEADILERIAAVRTDLLQAQADWGYMPNPDRYYWQQAEAGWVPYSLLATPGASEAERQRFSRTIKHLVAHGVLETQYSGRAKEVRVTPPPKTRRAKR